jgi:MurNAc alpha-1-phosphate uridylyltransferase
VNSDVACNFPLETLKQSPQGLAHLVFMPNPEHHPEGDFSLDDDGIMRLEGDNKLTFSGIGVYKPELFAGIPEGKLKLRPVLEKAMAQGLISGEKFEGFWMDIGTAERLQALENYYNAIRCANS